MGPDEAILARTAHELRVPLSLISGSLDMLAEYTNAMLQFVSALTEDRLSPSERDALHDRLHLGQVAQDAPEVLQICREGVRRLTHVVNRLRASGRRQNETPRPLALAPVVHSAARMLAHCVVPVAEISVHIDDSVWVLGDADALVQVFVNLLRNALDAVADTPAPRVEVWATLCPAQAGSQVEIRVRDNGPGIPPVLCTRIFEPFFSTKGGNRGVGLGLSIVVDLLQSMGGSIALSPSSPGAEFVVQLPAVVGALDGLARKGRPIEGESYT